MRGHVAANPRRGARRAPRARGEQQRPQRGLRALPAVRCRPLPRALRLDADRADRPAAPLHVDLARVRALRPHRRVPLVRDRLHEPAAAPPRGAGRLRRCRGRALRRGGGGARRDVLREPRARARASRPAGRLLDVGCHVGTFIELAERAGFEVAGVEPSRWAAKRAEARVRGPVHVGVVEDAPLPEGAYDVVTMWDVIEHLPDPASHAARRALRAAARAASSRSRRWTSRRSSRASPGASGPGTCRCTSSTSRAARSASCCAAAASRSSRSRATAGSCASPTPSRASARYSRTAERVARALTRPPRRAHGGHRPRRHRHRGGAQARGLMAAPAQRARGRLTTRLAPGAAAVAGLPLPAARRRALAPRRGAAVRDGGLGHAPARRGRRPAADAARPRRVGRHLVPLDRRPRLRPDDRPRRQRGLPAALPDAPARPAHDRAVRRPRVARRRDLDAAHGGRDVPALQAHGRALRPHDRAAHGALPLDLAARVRVLGRLRREPLPRARRGHVPARRAPALLRRLAPRRARGAHAARSASRSRRRSMWMAWGEREGRWRRAAADRAAARGRGGSSRSTCGGRRAIRSRRRTPRRAAGAAASACRRS